MDQQTLEYYSANASDTAKRYESVVSSLSGYFGQSFRPESKLLDIGCGSGRDLSQLSLLGHSCYGIDATPEFVEIAQSLHPELLGRIVVAALPSFDPPFGGGFNGVLCSAVLMHLAAEDLPEAIKSISRCLATCGRLLYSVPNVRLDVDENGRDSNGRLFVPDQEDKIQSLFIDIGFKLIASWIDQDSLGRDSVAWKSVLMEKQLATNV